MINRFGVRAQDLPHPDVSFRDFRDQISSLNDKEPLVWSSDTKAQAKWIDMAKLTARYGPVGFASEAPRQPVAAAVHTPQWANTPTTYPGSGVPAAAPVYAAPAPVYPAAAPVYAAPAPVYNMAPAPVYSAPAPVYSAPAPVYSAPAPVYSAPAPVYSAPAPVYKNAPSNPPQYAPPQFAPPQYAPAPVKTAQPQYAPVNPSYVPPPSFSAAPCPVNAALVTPMASLNVAPSYPTSGSQSGAAPAASAPVPDYSMMNGGKVDTKAKGGMMSRLRGSK